MITITTLEELKNLQVDEQYLFESNDEIDLNGEDVTIPQGAQLSLDVHLKNGNIIMKANSTLQGHVEGENLGDASLTNIQIKPQGANITIRDIDIECATKTCVYTTYNCSGLVISNCYIKSGTKNGIKIVADNISGIIDGINIEYCQIEFGRMGIELQNHKNSQYKIQNVYIGGDANATYNVTRSHDGNSGVSRFNALSGDWSENYKYGISLTGYGKSTEIVGCNFSDCVKSIEIVGFSDVKIASIDIFNPGEYSIISSNSRQMNNIRIQDCTISGGKLMLYNTTNACITGNDITCSYVEIKKSTACYIYDNTITSTGHYSIMFNDAFSNYTWDNSIYQNSTNNWAVVRCYGKKATANRIAHNTITRVNSKGKAFDQRDGAFDNIYTTGKADFIDSLNINPVNEAPQQQVDYEGTVEINDQNSLVLDKTIVKTTYEVLKMDYKDDRGITPPEHVGSRTNYKCFVPEYPVLVPKNTYCYPIQYIRIPNTNNQSLPTSHLVCFKEGSIIPAGVGVIVVQMGANNPDNSSEIWFESFRNLYRNLGDSTQNWQDRLGVDYGQLIDNINPAGVYATWQICQRREPVNEQNTFNDKYYFNIDDRYGIIKGCGDNPTDTAGLEMNDWIGIGGLFYFLVPKTGTPPPYVYFRDDFNIAKAYSSGSQYAVQINKLSDEELARWRAAERSYDDNSNIDINTVTKKYSGKGWSIYPDGNPSSNRDIREQVQPCRWYNLTVYSIDTQYVAPVNSTQDKANYNIKFKQTAPYVLTGYTEYSYNTDTEQQKDTPQVSIQEQ